MPEPSWAFQVHFLLECLDALTEARQRAAVPGPALGLQAVLDACQTQGLGSRAVLPADRLGRGLLQAGWVTQDERLRLPRLTPAGIQALEHLRALDGSDPAVPADTRLESMRRKLLGDV